MDQCYKEKKGEDIGGHQHPKLGDNLNLRNIINVKYPTVFQFGALIYRSFIRRGG